MWHQIGNNRLTPKTERNSFQVNVHKHSKLKLIALEKVMHICTHTQIYIHIYIYDMQMIQSCESRHLPLSPPHPRVGVQGFAHRTWDFDFSMTFGLIRAVAGLCWAPSSAKDGFSFSFSFSLSLASGCSEVFSGFFGEGTLQDSSVSLQLQLLQSTHGKPQPRI